MFHRLAIIAAVFATFIPGAGTALAGEPSPHQIVRNTSAEVLSALKQSRVAGTATPEQLSEKLLEILEPVVDFDAIAKAVMGKHYETANSVQQQAFASIFRSTMLQLYAKSLIKFEITDIAVQNSTASSPLRDNITMNVSTTSGETYTIVYTMRKNKDGSWRVRNVVLDGINLGLTYRNQFYSAMERYQGNISKVISGWADEMNDSQQAQPNTSGTARVKNQWA